MLTYTRNGRDYASQNPARYETEDDQKLLTGSVTVLAKAYGVAPASIPYLLQYGWAQSLQDCIAGRAKKVREEMEAQNAAGTHDHSELDIMDAIEADLDGQLSKRMDSIVNGTMGQRETTVRDPFESMCQKVAAEMLAKHLKTNKVTLKRDSDKWKELLGQVRAKYASNIEAEAKRRLETTQTISIEL